MTAKNNTTRFSERVEDYVKYRPSYPVEIIAYLQDQWHLEPHARIADIGSGTGISTALFLQSGYMVKAIEPNLQMRAKSVELLKSFDRFEAVNGTAESTTLPNRSVDAVVAGQAFHWFNRKMARKEFSRILDGNGLVILIWNERKTSTDFEKAYDELILKHAHDYQQVDHRNIDEKAIAAFFHPGLVQLKVFANYQVFNFDGLLGRLLSSSYMPTVHDDGYALMVRDLQTLFNGYQHEGSVKINYDTNVYVGRLKK